MTRIGSGTGWRRRVSIGTNSTIDNFAQQGQRQLQRQLREDSHRGFVHCLALQLAGRHIRANTVSPGNTYIEGGVWQSPETGDPALFQTAVTLNPTGHMGSPDEIGAPVVFLASPLASRVSGTNLVVDGSLTRGAQL